MDKEKAKNRGDLIKKIRLSKGWKQADLASATGISRVTIGNYERGEREPNIENNIKIAEALSVSLDYLIYGDKSVDIDKNEVIELINDASKRQLKIIKSVLLNLKK